MKSFLLLVLSLSLTCISNAQSWVYRFNGNLADAGGANSLSQVLSCGATLGTITSQSVTTSTGSCGTGPLSVFAFNAGGGLAFPNNNNVERNYTIHVFFKFNTLGGYKRVIDFSDATEDAGIYLYNNSLNFYPSGNIGAPIFQPNTFYLVSLVRNSSTNVIKVYVNGSLFTSYTDGNSSYVPVSPTTPIVFFRDDVIAACEVGAGSVKYISIAPTNATDAEVQQAYNGICATVLPLTLTNFTAGVKGGSSLLEWQTRDEQNVSHFEVERSFDAVRFSSLGAVPAKNLAQLQNYTYSDKEARYGHNYYRLKMIDKDGKFTFSSVQDVVIDEARGLSVFPNPVIGSVRINGLANGELVKLLTTEGQLLYSKVVDGDGLTIRLERLKPGMYVLETIAGNNIRRTKLIKQ